MAKIFAFALALVFFFCATIVTSNTDENGNMAEPDLFYMGKVSQEDELIQEEMLRYKEFAPGQDHSFQAYKFDEDSGIFRYTKSRFRLHSRFLNLDNRGIESIECGKKKRKIYITTSNQTLADTLQEGDLIYFGRQWRSGCHRHHGNGPRGANFFKITAILTVKDLPDDLFEISAKISESKAKEMFEDGEFAIYQENIRSPISRKNTHHNVFEEEREGMSQEELEDLEKISTFRERNLPDEISSIVAQIQYQEEQEGAHLREKTKGMMQKRGFLSWLKKTASKVGGAIKKGVTAAVNFAKETGKKVVKVLKETATKAYNFVKDKVVGMIDGTYSKSFRPELPLTISKEFGPITLTGRLTFGCNIAVSFTIKSFKLKNFHIEIVGTASAGIRATIKKGNTKGWNFELPAKVSLDFNIPTPIPGLFFQINPYLKVDGSLTASFTVDIVLGGISARGEVGFKADYVPGPGWSVTPVKSFTWELEKPKINVAKASLTLTITPRVGINFGASALGVVSLRGGPQVNLPVTLTLSVSTSCTLSFSWSFNVALAIHIDFSIFSKALFEKDFSKNLISPKGGEYCLIKGFFGKKRSIPEIAQGKKKKKLN